MRLRQCYPKVARKKNMRHCEIWFGAVTFPPSGHIFEVAWSRNGPGGTNSMFDQLEKPPSFGVNDKPPCANCGQPSSLIRRSPDDFDRRYERQTFVCFKCDHEIERVVDAEGNSRR
jgi:hypothetical protein